MKIVLRIRDYIASPMSDALSEKIGVEKRSRMAFCRTDEKRAAALKAQLDKEGLTMENWEEICKEAAQRWYRNPDGQIIIPRHHLAGMLVQTIGVTPKALHAGLTKDSFRSLVRLSDFVTDRKEKDTLFSRFVKSDKTNERRYQSDEVIENFSAIGTAEVDEDVEPDDFFRLLSYALKNVGLGSARKMGYGRGEIIEPKTAPPKRERKKTKARAAGSDSEMEEVEVA